jgi:hypothetical protein
VAFDPFIWDTFTYAGEKDILNIRRRELDALGTGIAHMAIEATRTFSGKDKTLALERSWDAPTRTAQWVVNLPDGLTAAEKERYQRDAGADLLDVNEAQPDDLVLFGDVDEIPTVDAIYEAVDLLANGSRIVTIRMPYHSLLATRRLPLAQDRWNHRWPVIATYETMKALGGLSAAREGSPTYAHVVGGWHLSSMGGGYVATNKARAFVHYDEPWVSGMDAARVKALALANRDIADRFDQEEVPIAELPLLLREDVATEKRPLAVMYDVDFWAKAGYYK